MRKLEKSVRCVVALLAYGRAIMPPLEPKLLFCSLLRRFETHGPRDAKEQYSRKSANFLAIRFDLVAYNKMAACWLATLDLSRLAA